MTHQL